MQAKLISVLFFRRRRRSQRRKHRFWVQNVWLNWNEIGEYKLFQEVFDHDHESFLRYLRRSPE